MNYLALMMNYLFGKIRKVYFMALPENQQDMEKSRNYYIAGDTAAQTIAQLAGGTFLVFLLSFVGFSDGNIGIITSLGSVAAFSQLLAILFEHKLKKNKFFIVASSLQRMWLGLLFFVPFLPWTVAQKQECIVLVFLLAQLVIQLGTPGTINWIATLVPNHCRGVYFAKKDAVATFVVVLYMLIAGVLLDQLQEDNPYAGLLLIGGSILVLTLVNVVALSKMCESRTSFLNKEGKELHGVLAKKQKALEHNLAQKKEEIFAVFFQDVSATLKKKRFQKLLLLNCLWMLSFFSASPFNASYQLKELDLSYTFIMVCSFICSLLRVWIYPKMGKMSDRIGSGRVLIIVLWFYALNYVFMMLASPANAWLIIPLASLVAAVAWSFIGVGLFNIQLAFMDTEKRVIEFAVLSSFSGVFGFGVSFIFGKLLNFLQKSSLQIGDRKLYAQQITNAIGVAFVLVMLLYIKKVIERDMGQMGS